MAAEELNDVVDDAGGHDDFVLCAIKAAHDVEHGGKHHADGDGVGHIGQEEDGLQRLLQELDGVERHGDQQRQQGRNGHRPQAQKHRVFQARYKALVLDHLDKVAKAQVKCRAARGLEAGVVFQQRHAHGVDDRPYGKHHQQHQRRGKIKPRLPLFAVYHITSPQRECALRFRCQR